MVPVIERIVAEHDVLVSVDTYKPEVAEAAVAAGAGMVNDVSGLRDPALAEICARTGAALVIMHTRVAPKGTLLDPGAYDDVVEDVVGFLVEQVAVARSRGVGEWQIVLDPGPDFAKTPAQTVAVLRRLDAVRVARASRPARGLAQGLPRRDHGPRGARPGRRARSRRSRPGSTPGRASCACTTSPRRPISSPSGRCCAASASSRPTRASRPTASRSASLLRARLPAAVTTRPGADRPIPKKRRPHVFRARPLRPRGVSPCRSPPARQRARRRRLPPPPQGRPDRRDRRQAGRRGLHRPRARQGRR